MEKKLHEQFAEKLKAINRKRSTIRNYVGHYLAYMKWVARSRGRFIHPKELGKDDLEAYLSYIANDRAAAPGSQNQAFFALLSFYRVMFGIEFQGVNALRAKKNSSVRVGLSQPEIQNLLEHSTGMGYLVVLLLYSSGMRVRELAKIRLKDFDFDRCQAIVYEGKGGKSRVIQFPELCHDAVRKQMEFVRVLWKADIDDGKNGVSLPHAYGRKCSSAHHELGWYYLFPADGESRDPDSNFFGRHHVHEDTLRDWMAVGIRKCGFMKKYTPHNLRHSYATHMLENGVPIHTVQKLMGHVDIRTTEGYLHLCKAGPTSAKSPIDFLNVAVKQRNQEKTVESIQSPLREMLRSPQRMKEARRDMQTQHPRQGASQLKIFVG